MHPDELAEGVGFELTTPPPTPDHDYPLNPLFAGVSFGLADACSPALPLLSTALVVTLW